MMSEPPLPIFSLSTLDWTAIGALGTVATAIVTVVLAGTAYWQISAAREEARTDRTLTACDQHDLDPVLDQVNRSLSKARDNNEFKTNLAAHRFDIITRLNYLESVAIGVRRGLYDETLVKEHLESIFDSNIQEFMASGIVRELFKNNPIPGDDIKENFSEMVALHKKWTDIPWYRRCSCPRSPSKIRRNEEKPR